MTAIANYHKHNGLKQQRSVLLSFWKPEFWYKGVGPHFFGDCKGDSIPRLFVVVMAAGVARCVSTWLTSTSVFKLPFLQCVFFKAPLPLFCRGMYDGLYCCGSVAQACLTLCHLMHCSMPGFLLLHHLLEFAQTHVHWVGEATHLSHSLSSLLFLPSIFPSIRVFSNELALPIMWPKYWSLFQYQSFQWILRTDFL